MIVIGALGLSPLMAACCVLAVTVITLKSELAPPPAMVTPAAGPTIEIGIFGSLEWSNVSVLVSVIVWGVAKTVGSKLTIDSSVFALAAATSAGRLPAPLELVFMTVKKFVNKALSSSVSKSGRWCDTRASCPRVQAGFRWRLEPTTRSSESVRRIELNRHIQFLPLLVREGCLAFSPRPVRASTILPIFTDTTE